MFLYQYHYVDYSTFRNDFRTLGNLCKLKMGQPPKCYESSPYYAWAGYSNSTPKKSGVYAPYSIWIRDEQINSMFLLAR